MMKRRSVRKQNTKRGFTLIEAMVAITLFAIVGGAAVSGVISAQSLARRSQASSIAFDNVSYALENMSRLIKVGRSYHCGSTGVLTVPQDCASNPVGPQSTFAFAGADGKNYVYDLTAGYIRRASCTPQPGCIPDVSTGVPITSPSAVTIQKLDFYVSGSGVDEVPPQQARVLILLQGVVNNPTGPIPFNLQTSLSQRRLEN